MGKWPAVVVLSLLWCRSSNGRASPVATIGHVAHARLLLVPTSAIGTLTSQIVATVEHMAHMWLLLVPTLAMSTLTSQTIATVGHVAHTRLLLVPTAVMSTLTLAGCCYCGGRGTRVVAASAHISDGHFDIMDRCYCWTCGTRTVAASVPCIDGHPDNSGLLLLLDTWHMRDCY
jgi:hypothetical protein